MIKIQDIPFQNFLADYKEFGKTKWHDARENKHGFLSAYPMKSFNEVFPAIEKHFSTLPINDKGEGGLISGKDFVLDNNTEWFVGLLAFCVLAQRSKVCSVKLTDPIMAPYASMTPLILSGHRKYNDTPYARWDTKGLGWVVQEELAEAMLWTKHTSLKHQGEVEKEWFDNNMTLDEESNEWAELNINDHTDAYASNFKVDTKGSFGYTPEQLIEFRNLVTTTRAGKTFDIKSSNNMFSVRDFVFDSMPKYVRYMACQTWLAHPSNRSEYMVLDPQNWDDMPDQLITAEIFNNEPTRDISNPECLGDYLAGLPSVSRKVEEVEDDADVPWNLSKQ